MRALRALALCTAAVFGFGGCSAEVTSVGAWAAPRKPTGHYIEAEDGDLSGGFGIGTSSVASGGKFIDAPPGVAAPDSPGMARARYTVTIAEPATYLVWGRIHSPDPYHNSLWFQIDGGVWHLWRISTGDVFYWYPLHDGTDYYDPLAFDLITGVHAIVFANAVESVQLDRLYFTADGDVPPGNDTPCDPPDSIELNGVCVASCGSQGGNACGEEECAGLPAIPVYDCWVCCAKP